MACIQHRSDEGASLLATTTLETPAQQSTNAPEEIHLPALNITEIMELIPHRYPFLLLDRVTEHVQGKYIRGYKNITLNEPFFPGHFPNRPIMPGVLQVEALAQLGSVLLACMPEVQGKLAVFAGIEKVRFRRMVQPGDRLDLESTMTKFRGSLGKAHGVASVNGEVVVEGELMFSLID